jgi:hypothetical protein
MENATITITSNTATTTTITTTTTTITTTIIIIIIIIIIITPAATITTYAAAVIAAATTKKVTLCRACLSKFRQLQTTTWAVGAYANISTNMAFPFCMMNMQLRFFC